MKVKECEVNRKTRCKSGRSYIKAVSVQIHKKKKLQVKFVQTEISNKLSESKVMEGDN